MAAVGVPTRGTTMPNRLRRVDRWLADTHGAALRRASDPLVVDLGFGASPVTTLELADRLRRVRPDVRVVGLEIDRERVTAAGLHARPGVEFRHGGFELPVDGRPVLVRAMNVLRQYPEDAVAGAWRRVAERLAPDGVLVEGTCDEPGRRGAWLTIDAEAQPRALTLAARLADLDRPGELAERLPKALIHRNLPGEPVHDLLAALDHAWAVSAPYAAFGKRQRWLAATARLAADGWPVLSRRRQLSRGEVSLRWPCLPPTSEDSDQ